MLGQGRGISHLSQLMKWLMSLYSLVCQLRNPLEKVQLQMKQVMNNDLMDLKQLIPSYLIQLQTKLMMAIGSLVHRLMQLAMKTFLVAHKLTILLQIGGPIYEDTDAVVFFWDEEEESQWTSWELSQCWCWTPEPPAQGDGKTNKQGCQSKLHKKP